MKTVQEIETAVRTLSDDEYGLFRDWLCSFEYERGVFDLHPEWEEELRRRMNEIENGSEKGIPFDKVFSELNERLKNVSRSVRFHSSAGMELTDVAEWYQQKRSGMGAEFSDEVRQALIRIKEQPDAYPKTFLSAQRCLISRFPYSLIFKQTGSVIWALAIAHTSRRPDYWKERF